MREAAGCSHWSQVVGGIELTRQSIQAEDSIVERAVIPARGHILDKQTTEDKDALLGLTVRKRCSQNFRLADYNKSLAAKQLGLTRFSLDRRLKKLADN